MRKTGQLRAACDVVALALSLLAAASGCNPRTDVVAHRLQPDARVDAGCLDPGACDAAADASCDGGACAPRGTCTSQACSSAANATAFCSAAEPATVTLGDSCDASGRTSFRYAVCACGDLITNSGLEVDSLDGTAPVGSASIAINDELRLGPDTSIDGSLYVTGRYSAATSPRVAGDLVQNARPACACDPAQLLDVAALVKARAGDNDDARAQLTAASLNGFGSTRTLSLDCGRYYFDRIAGGTLQIEARGRIALFIASDLTLDGGLNLTLQDGARAEIFIGGNVRVAGRLELSTSNDGNRVLLAVQGSGTIDLADAIMDGTLYAPHAELVTRGPFELHGSLFVKRANFGDAARVHYQPLPAARTTCAP